jgi:lysozyme
LPRLIAGLFFGVLFVNYDRLFNQLKRHEGIRFSAYKCSRGFWTVGVGRNLEHNPLSGDEQLTIFGQILPDADVIRRLMFSALSTEHVELLFLNDVAKAEELCHKHLPMSELNDARKAVFINMVFQMGVNGVLKFEDTVRFAGRGEFDLCATAMLDSKWFRLDSPGRAQELSDQMLSGEWQ